MKNNCNLFEPISNDNLLFSVALLLLFFPPLPVALNSLIFKWQSVIIFFFFVETIFLIFLKNKLEIIPIKYILLFFIPALWGLVVGLINNNNYFKMFRDFYFFVLPILIYFLLANNKRFYSMFFSKSFETYIIIVATIQLLSSFYGFVFCENRPEFRHMHFLFSTSLLSLYLILNIINYWEFFNWKNFLVIAGLISTLGRMNFIFIGAMFVTYIFATKTKQNLFRKLFLIFLVFLPTIGYFSPLFFKKINWFTDMSVKWRYLEWKSFFEQISQQGTYFGILLGEGFGAALKTIKPLHLFSGKILYSVDKFHNIILFLVFKLGICGMIFLILFLFYLGFYNSSFLKIGQLFFIRVMIIFVVFVNGLVYGGFTMGLYSGVFLGILLFAKESMEQRIGD
ncbi:O-antigen ligase family protein [Nautilia sp.]